MTTTYTAITGSSLTYEPPAGTVLVIYEFVTQVGLYSATPIISVRAYLDGTEITDAFTAQAGSYRDDRFIFKWGLNIGGTANASTGRVASWSGTKTIELKAREYGGSNQGNLHTTSYTDGGGTDTFVRPSVGITAIGVPS